MTALFARRSFRAVAVGLGGLLIAACSNTSGGTPSSQPSGSSTDVTVWTAWGGNELKAFNDVLAPFQQQNHITVHITTVRDANQLAVAVQAGSKLPDIAAGPTTDKLQSWVNKGTMKPIENVLGDKFNDYMNNTVKSLTTPPSGNTDLQIGVVNGKHYQMYVKTQVKGLFWYNTKVFTGSPPKTWDDLLKVQPAQGAKLFCVGLESGSASGWPGVDDIDNIVMRQAGHKTYNDWIAGKVKWSSSPIKQAYQTFGQMVAPQNLYGGANTALTTNFGKAGDPMFTNPPGCMFLEQATFITSFFEQDNPGVKSSDYNFFPHPSINSANDGNVNGFADQFAVYNDTPAARKLMQYMATKEAQQIWVNDGGTLAANKQVTYNDPISKAAFDVVAKSKNLEVTAGDFMPSDMQAAFWKSILDYVNNPGNLDSILSRLDQVQAASYTS